MAVFAHAQEPGSNVEEQCVCDQMSYTPSIKTQLCPGMNIADRGKLCLVFCYGFRFLIVFHHVVLLLFDISLFAPANASSSSCVAGCYQH